MKLASLLEEDLIIVSREVSPLGESLSEILERILLGSDGGGERGAYLVKLRPQIERGGLGIVEKVSMFHLTIPEIEDSRLGVKVMGGKEGSLLFLLSTPRTSPKFYLQVSTALRKLALDRPTLLGIKESRSPGDLLERIDASNIVLNPKVVVRDLFRRDIVTVESGEPIRTVVNLMVFKGVGGIVVTDRNGKVLGVITESDLLRIFLPELMTTLGESDQRSEEAALQGDIGERYSAKDFMSRSVMCISEDTPVTEAAAMMLNKKVRRIPVVKEGELTGIISLEDIIRKVLRSWFV